MNNRDIRAADAAKRLLHRASKRLLTSDPTQYLPLNNALDQSLDWPIGHSLSDPSNKRTFEPNFSETAANSLSFLVSPGGNGITLHDGNDIATQVMRNLVGHQFGKGALRWFDERSESMRSRYGQPSSHQNAMFSTSVDRSGLAESAVTYGLGNDMMQMLPPPVMEMAQTAMQALDGLVPFYTTIRCGRHSGGQQISFSVNQETPLSNFQPLMAAFGMGHRHGGLMSLAAFIMGARFTLPAGTATITLFRTRHGVEMRLDINLDALPDTPAQLLPLLRLPMVERPRSLNALDRWLTALTPDGYYGPGNISVLSIRVSAEMPARLALFLRPVAFQPQTLEPDQGPMPEDEFSLEQMPQPPAAQSLHV